MARIGNSEPRKSTESMPKVTVKAPPPKTKSPVTSKDTKKLSKDLTKKLQSDVGSFGNSKKATVTRNKDGSFTQADEFKKKGTETKRELTFEKGKLGASQLSYSKTKTKGDTETKDSVTAKSNLAGRVTSSSSHSVTVTKDGTVDAKTSKTDNAKFGTKTLTTKTEEKSFAATVGDTTMKVTDASSTGPGGAKWATHEESKAVKDGRATTTTTSKTTTGTSFKTETKTNFEDGKFTASDSADWKKNSVNSEKTKSKEWDPKTPVTPDKGFSQKNADSKLDKAKLGGDILGAAGVKKTLVDIKADPKDMKESNWAANKEKNFVGTRVGTATEAKVTFGANGLDAKAKAEAKAGIYAETKGATSGKYGTAGYTAGAKAEAKASVDAKGKLNLNGLDAEVKAKVGASVEASVTGKATTKPLKVAGVDLTAGVEGSAKASAEVSAEVNAKVKATRNPPTIIAEGSAGASAVAKIEGEVKASAGPFAVKASAYGSAGAEAKISGVIGYENGKLKLSGSAGAALGLGAGASVGVEVDVAQIGSMAKNAAVSVGDVNGDGKLGLDDAKAAAGRAKDKVKKWLSW